MKEDPEEESGRVGPRRTIRAENPAHQVPALVVNTARKKPSQEERTMLNREIANPSTTKLYMLIIICIVGVISCTDRGPPADELANMSVQENALTESRNLLNQGSCDFLRNCSIPSINAGRVVWGCQTRIPDLQSQGCSDSMLWVAVPNIDYCGLPFHICTPSGRCVDAQGWDISNKGVWEGSPAVLRG
jgi:hypothetical protein